MGGEIEKGLTLGPLDELAKVALERGVLDVNFLLLVLDGTTRFALPGISLLAVGYQRCFKRRL